MSLTIVFRSKTESVADIRPTFLIAHLLVDRLRAQPVAVAVDLTRESLR
jgi:hypothetical protein